MNVRNALLYSAIFANICSNAAAQFGNVPYFEETIGSNLANVDKFGESNAPEQIESSGYCPANPNFSCGFGADVTTTYDPKIAVNGNGQASGLSAVGGELIGGANGQIGYSFLVQEVTPPPQFIPFVPIWLSGYVSAEASGNSRAGAKVSFYTSDSSVEIVLADASVVEDDILPFDFSVYGSVVVVRRNAVVTIRMVASGILTFSEGAGSYSAVADPYVEIDPSFEYKDYFRIVFNSPGILNTPPIVPEPANVALLVFGAFGIVSFYN
jgi:hypothetical protein